MFTKSIRWRLQIWLAFLLVFTLTGFGIATYEAHRVKQYQQVDEELRRRVEGLAMLVRGRLTPWGGRPHFEERFRREPPLDRIGPPPRNPGSEASPDRFDDRQQPLPPPGESTNAPPSSPAASFEIRLPPEAEALLREDQQRGIYFVVWNGDGAQLDGSTNAPINLPRPGPTAPDSGPYFRTRDVYREAFEFNREGRSVLVGRSIAAELEAQRSFAFILVFAGAGVLALGLGGGWLIAGRAMRPLMDISTAASRISAGNLSERVNVAETDSELGQLASTLNSTFARLEAAFVQQQQFTADASHELRTPIAVIISEAQTTLARERPASEYRETIEACLDTAQQMRRLTESLLELANLDASQQSAKRESLDLAELARQRVEFIHPLADQRSLRLTCKFSPARTSGNADHLGLVINNLLSNAIYYNKTGGEITLATGVEAGKVFASVTDTGRGIAAEDLPLIFDRFYRADKSRSHAEGRSGLGLAICKAIVEAHGGSIHVASELGLGTTLTVQLPA